MTLPFAIIAIITVASAVAAMTLRNLVHCALSLTLTFAGLAALYLQLNVQFVGFAQILVYVGAVAILIVFAILLTRGIESPEQKLFSSSWLSGLIVAVAVFAVLSIAVASSTLQRRIVTVAPEVSVRQIGDQLMTKYIVPLEVVGLLLTAALIGAVIIAMDDKESK
jgi:NADH-quinone oxidoreductase subunit J